MDERALAAAVLRCQELLVVMDREHTSQELHARARAIRHELRTMARMLPPVKLADWPSLARPSGEQQDLTDPDQCLDITVVRDHVPRDLLGNPLQ